MPRVGVAVALNRIWSFRFSIPWNLRNCSFRGVEISGPFLARLFLAPLNFRIISFFHDSLLHLFSKPEPTFFFLLFFYTKPDTIPLAPLVRSQTPPYEQQQASPPPLHTHLMHGDEHQPHPRSERGRECVPEQRSGCQRREDGGGRRGVLFEQRVRILEEEGGQHALEGVVGDQQGRVARVPAEHAPPLAP